MDAIFLVNDNKELVKANKAGNKLLNTHKLDDLLSNN